MLDQYRASQDRTVFVWQVYGVSLGFHDVMAFPGLSASRGCGGLGDGEV